MKNSGADYGKKDGNGTILKRHKHHDTTPEHIGFTVNCREEWEKIKPYLTKIDERRINFEVYREYKNRGGKARQYFVWTGIGVFECMASVCGHENMLAVRLCFTLRSRIPFGKIRK